MSGNGEHMSVIAGLALIVFLTLAGCGTTEPVAVRDKAAAVQALEQQQIPSYQRRHSIIAPEYMPPPGKCRIWYPARPPEHQPPPGDCADLEHHLPPNTWLLRSAEQ